MAGEPTTGRGEFDDSSRTVDDGIAESQVQHRQFLFKVGCQQHHRCRRGHVANRGSGHAKKGSGQAITELRVVTFNTECGAQLRPRPCVFIGASSATDHAD